MKIIRSKEFTASRPWGALDIANISGVTARLHWPFMICRIWHGRTLRTSADAYTSFLEQRAIPDYRSVPGNQSVAVLRRDEGDVTHFLTVTH